MHQHHHVEARYDEQALPAVSDTGDPVDFLPGHERAAEPELVAIEEGKLGVDLGRGCRCDPVRRHDLPSLPCAVVQHELADLDQVPRPHAKP